MITKFGGKPCHYCGELTEANVDHYDKAKKISYHEVCMENQPPGPEAYAMADFLGWLPSDEAMNVNWTERK